MRVIRALPIIRSGSPTMVTGPVNIAGGCQPWGKKKKKGNSTEHSLLPTTGTHWFSGAFAHTKVNNFLPVSLESGTPAICSCPISKTRQEEVS